MSSENGNGRLHEGSNGTAVETAPRESIRWIEEEYDKLANEMLKIFLNHPGEAWVGLIKKAQSVLQEHRRRNIISIKNVPILEKKFLAQIEELKANAHKGSQPPPPPPAPPPAPEPKIIHVQTDPQELLDSMHPAQLLLTLFSRIWDKMDATDVALARIAETQENAIIQMQAIMARANRAEPTPPTSQKVKKTKVAVCGPRRDYFAQIDSAIGRDFTLIFIEKDLGITYPEVDYFVLARKFVGHSHEAKAHSRYKPGQVLVIDGGAATIAQQIKKLCIPKPA